MKFLRLAGQPNINIWLTMETKTGYLKIINSIRILQTHEGCWGEILIEKQVILKAAAEMKI